MKQVILSMVAVLIAAGIFAGMVVYTLGVIREAQMQILQEEFGVIFCE